MVPSSRGLLPTRHRNWTCAPIAVAPAEVTAIRDQIREASDDHPREQAEEDRADDQSDDHECAAEQKKDECRGRVPHTHVLVVHG